ncbi:Anaphase-promoting complex subunit 10 [Glycine max]|nr:Anaphase-promoting complex subunit 10 [Glycine max]
MHSRFSFSSHLKSARNRSVDTHIAPHSFRYCRKPLAGTHRTSYRRKVDEKPTLRLELCGSKKPYTALGTVVGAQSSKLSMLSVNKLIVLFLVFKLDESYTPSKVSIRAGCPSHSNPPGSPSCELLSPCKISHVLQVVVPGILR